MRARRGGERKTEKQACEGAIRYSTGLLRGYDGTAVEREFACCVVDREGKMNTPTTHLLLSEDEVVELLLQHLVGVVDQELLVEVVGENLETEDVQQPDEPMI